MILDTAEKELSYQSSETVDEMAFGIKEQDVSHIIMLLRQQMYRFPIEAICREVASNARDANREVGKGHIPIGITIGKNPFMPGSCCLSIEDCGPGISPARMADVFICYGASTKRGSNEQTGGFGLGAKTPFAYTDHFLIETCVEGFRFTYTAMITQGNRGRMVLLSKEEFFGEAPFGTKITVPFKDEDRMEFEDRCYQSTYFWDVRPNYGGFDLLREQQTITEVSLPAGIPLRIQRHTPNKYQIDFMHGQQVGVLLDGIPYPLEEFSDFKGALISASEQGNVFFLECKPGELSLAPSRESLHYDQKTRNHLEKLIKECMNSMMTASVDYLSALPKKILFYGMSVPQSSKLLEKDFDNSLLPEGISFQDISYFLYLGTRVLGVEALTRVLLSKDLADKVDRLNVYSAEFSTNITTDGVSCLKTFRSLSHLNFADKVVVQDNFGFDSHRNRLWQKEGYKRFSVVMTVRGKGIKKKDVNALPGKEIVEILNALGVDSVLYSTMPGAPRVARPKPIVPNCVFCSFSHGGRHFNQRSVRISLEKDGFVSVDSKERGHEEFPLDKVIVKEDKAAEGYRDAYKKIVFLRTYSGKGSADDLILLDVSDVKLEKRLRSLAPVYKEAIQAKVIMHGKRLTRELKILRLKEALENNHFAQFLLEKDIPYNNQMYPLAKKLRALKETKVSDATLRVAGSDVLPHLMYESPEALNQAINLLEKHPLARIIYRSWNFNNAEFEKAFLDFISITFKITKTRTVCQKPVSLCG